jgi:hypothetical protein
VLQSVKSRFAYKLKTDDKERRKLAFSIAIGHLQTGVQITKGITSNVGLGPPGLHTGLNGLLIVLGAIQVAFKLYSMRC